MKVPSPIRYANDHPWIYVVLAFLILITAWTTFIILAVKNRPDPLPEQTFPVRGPQSEIRNPQPAIE